MKRRVLLVRHGPGPYDDRVVGFLARNGLVADIRCPFAGDMLGEVEDDIAGTVVYGGPYNAYDTRRHPFLNEEYRWIGAAMDAGLPVLGICQGAQMIAHHAGAWVGAHPEGWHEFGYYRIDPEPGAGDFLPAPLFMAQAHFHTFDIPAGGERLASSALYPNQAFRIGGNVYGLQFHAEQTIAGFRRWQGEKTAAHGLPGTQDRQEQTRLMLLHDGAQSGWFNGFLARLFPACR